MACTTTPLSVLKQGGKKNMLVLSRKPGERLLIGEPPNQIVVTVIRINSNTVRLGIDAPTAMPILREEVKQAIETEEARKPPPSEVKQ